MIVHTLTYRAPSLAHFTALMEKLLQAKKEGVVNVTLGPCVGLVNVTILGLVGHTETLEISLGFSESPKIFNPRVK